jgi:hypothetical protein
MWCDQPSFGYLAISMKTVIRIKTLPVILAVLLLLPLSFAQSGAKDDPIEALAGKWDIKCAEKGCMMFTDVLIGDPDHPADLNHPEYITIAVAINRSDRKIAFIDFDLPPDADRAQGFFIAFAKTTMDEKKYKSSLDKDAMVHLNFFTCDKDSCIGRALGGLVESQGSQKEDLLQEFLNSNHILFLYTKNGVPYRTIKALFPFQRAYQNLMETELKPVDK